MLVISYQMAHGQIVVSNQVFGGVSRGVVKDLASRAPYLAILAILPATVGIGLYLMANWARILALVLYCLSLLACMSGWLNLMVLQASNVKIPEAAFNSLLLQTAVYGCVVIYLFRPRVQRAFHDAYHRL